MIGPEAHIHLWTAPRKKITQRVLKINAFLRSLVERLCDVKIYALSVVGYIGSISAPDEATLKAGARALRCTIAGPYNAIPTQRIRRWFRVSHWSCLWLASTLPAIAARYRTAACSNTLSQGLEKIQAARGCDFAPILALSSNWEKEFLAPSMARSTAAAFNIVRRLDRKSKLDEFPQDRKQKAATTLLRDEFLGRTLLDGFLYVPSGFLDRSVVIELQTFCLT